MKKRTWLLVLAGVLIGTPAAAQGTYLKAFNSDAGDRFGDAVAIDGNTLVVGAGSEDTSSTGIDPPDDNGLGNSGAAYVFSSNGSSWSQTAFLKASNAGLNDVFGAAVAIDGDTLVVGAPQESSSATGVNGNQSSNSFSLSGAAYVFVRSGTTWVQEAYLKPSNTGVQDLFGAAVAVSGDTILVGSPWEDSGATGVDGDQGNALSMAGAVYVFRRSGTTWSQEAYVKASNTGASDQFGSTLAISGDTIVVGAPGEDSSATGVNGNQNSETASASGAAYVFARSGTAWSQQAYLKSSNTQAGDAFGGTVAVDADTVVVGSRMEGTLYGAAYVFHRSGSTWSLEARLEAPNLESGDQFGTSVSIAGDTIAVGAPLEDSAALGVGGDLADNSATWSGAAYTFVRVLNDWCPAYYVKATNADPGDQFGWVLDVSGTRLVVGAFIEDGSTNLINGPDDDAAIEAGAAYVYDLTAPPIVYCTPKTSSAGCVAILSTSAPAPPTSGDADFAITASDVQERKIGLLFAGITGPTALPFLGGTLCIQPPWKRGPLQSSGGTDPNGCAGSFTTIVNDGVLVPSGLDAGPGGTTWNQYWYLDLASPSGSALSNAVQVSFE